MTPFDMLRFTASTALFVCLLGSWTQPVRGADVVIVTGAEAPAIERFAGEELADQFVRVFDDVDVEVTDAPTADAEALVLVGSPATNSHVREIVGESWPDLTDQGLVIRTTNRSGAAALIVGGGSPVATLWAVYELGHQLGIRYLLHGDIDPAEKRELDISGYDVVQEPVLRERTWRTINDFAIGPESWGLEDHRRILHQLAKLKYNRLMLQVYPWQPFVRYEFGGVSKQTAVLWYGEEYRLDSDSAGRKAFQGRSVFENPDFAGVSGFDEMTDAGIAHVRGLIDAAHGLGMSVGLSISPLEFPREFQPVLEGSTMARGINHLTIIPGGRQGPTDEVLRDLTATKIRAYVETYADLDTLYLSLPEFPEWDQHAEAAWQLLMPRLGEHDLSLEELVRSASERSLIASGARGEQAVKGNIVGLAFFQSLLADERLLRRPDGTTLELVVTQVDPALFPILDRVVPEGAATLNFVDYTARRVAEHRDLLAAVPAEKVDSRLILTLADDNVGVLPQSALRSLGQLTTELKRNGWTGFSTRYWLTAELDTPVHVLSRASWNRESSFDAESVSLWTDITGDASVADRLRIGWDHLEDATDLIDRNDIGFAFPVQGMLMKHFVARPAPEWWQETIDHYTQYMTEMYRAHGAAAPRAKPLLFYYAKRGEYALQYWGAVQAVRAAAIAEDAGDRDEALSQLEEAMELTYNCIDTLADVAQDQSDLGLIAVLNAYAWRPLLAEYDRLSEDP
jgi:hypothetical protein